MKHFSFLMTMLSSLSLMAAETVAPLNYEEAKIPPFVLPDALVSADDKKVDTAEIWTQQRQPELLKLFEENVYGKPTLSEIKMYTEQLESVPAFNGKAIRYQFQLVFFNGDKPAENDPKVDFLVYVPADKDVSKKFPVFLGLNFAGNHTVSADPGILLPKLVWGGNGKTTPGTDEERGIQNRRWSLETILDHGFAVGTAYYGDFEPDFNGGIKHGVRRLLYKDGENPKPDEGNAIATWAWGLCKSLMPLRNIRTG